MQPRQFVLALALALSMPAFAAPFEVSADGQEVTDLGTALVWRRCVEGMAWDGSTCSGQALRFTLAKARTHAQAVAARKQ